MGPCRAPRADLSSWRTKETSLCVRGGGDVRLFGGKGDNGQMAGDFGAFEARILHFRRNLRHLQE